MIPKISVLVICYNQEDCIRRALDSLVSQKEHIYEICINDDASTDGTWDIIKKYQSEYPNLIKPVRNQPNLGIFKNIEATWNRPTGDLIYRLSGDDECPIGYFSHVIDFISKNNIDYKNKAVCIYGNYQQINPNGTSIVYHNDLILVNNNTIKLKIRKLISNRSACFSRKVLERYIKVAKDRSYIIEFTQDAELQIFSDYNYYIPQIGNIYYAGIGVSKNFTKQEREEHLKVFDHFLSFCKSNGIHIGQSDRNYIKYMKHYRRGNWGKAFGYYIMSIDTSLGWKGLQLDRITFVLRNRILRIFH